MVSDPDGIYYSVGEADREIAERDDLIRRMAGMMNRARPERISIAGPQADPFDPKYLICCPFCVTAGHSDEKILTTLEHEDDCPWFEIIKEAEQCAGIEFNDILDMCAVDPNIEKWQKAWREANGTGVMTQEALYPEWLAKLDGTWMEETYEAGTHDGGTVPEGDRPSTGPASARDDEDTPE